MCDGFISRNKIDLPISDKLGDWKIEKEGKIYIENLGTKKWLE